MKEKFIEPFMKTAETFAELSTAKRLKVGCIAVKDNRIISIGYNGTPSGLSNECEETIVTYDTRDIDNTWDYNPDTKQFKKLKTKQEVHHAERNALDKIARSNESSEGAVLFVTHAPCIECAKSIYACGITEVYYRNHYEASLGSGLDFLERVGVKTIHVEENK
jgi:dCMP deaminase